MKNETTAKRVFIVDDDRFFREIMKHELTVLTDMQVETFSSASECINALDSSPDLIILDLNLEAEDVGSHAALDQIHNLEQEPKVLFVSGRNNEELLLTYRKFRQVDFMLKEDMQDEALTQRVHQLLKAS